MNLPLVKAQEITLFRACDSRILCLVFCMLVP